MGMPRCENRKAYRKQAGSVGSAREGTSPNNSKVKRELRQDLDYWLITEFTVSRQSSQFLEKATEIGDETW